MAGCRQMSSARSGRPRRQQQQHDLTRPTKETPMATIKASLFMALDGAVDPGVGNWHFPYFNDQMGKAVTDSHEADVMLFGRVTYDSFAGAWPDREAAGGDDAPFAKRL